MNNQQMYVPGQIPYGQDLVQALIALRDVERFIIDQTPEYRLWSTLLSELGAPKRVRRKRTYEIPYRGNITQTATIKTRSLVNGILTLNWDDPTLEIVRKDEILQSAGTKTRGRAVDAGLGYAKLVFISTPISGQTAFDTNDFIVSSQVYFRGVQPSVNNPNVGTERLMTMPKLRYNNVAHYIDSFSYTGEEARTPSYIDMMQDGKKVIIEQNEQDTIRRVYEMYAANVYDGQQATVGDSYYYADGIDNQITKGQGVIQPYSGTLQENIVQSVIEQASANGAFQNGEILFICNTKFKMQFQQNVTQNYIQNTGILNTFGGKEVKGIDVDNYQAVGLKCKFVIDPQLNDQLKYENTAIGYGFSTMMVKTTDGMKPFAYEEYMAHPDIQVNRYRGTFNPDGSWNPNPQLRTAVTAVDVVLDKTLQLSNPQQCVKIFGV